MIIGLKDTVNGWTFKKDLEVGRSTQYKILGGSEDVTLEKMALVAEANGFDLVIVAMERT